LNGAQFRFRETLQRYRGRDAQFGAKLDAGP